MPCAQGNDVEVSRSAVDAGHLAHLAAGGAEAHAVPLGGSLYVEGAGRREGSGDAASGAADASTSSPATPSAAIPATLSVAPETLFGADSARRAAGDLNALADLLSPSADGRSAADNFKLNLFLDDAGAEAEAGAGGGGGGAGARRAAVAAAGLKAVGKRSSEEKVCPSARARTHTHTHTHAHTHTHTHTHTDAHNAHTKCTFVRARMRPADRRRHTRAARAQFAGAADALVIDATSAASGARVAAEGLTSLVADLDVGGDGAGDEGGDDLLDLMDQA